MKKLIYFIAMLFATQVVAQDYSGNVLPDTATMEVFQNKDNHFAFMGISFYQPIRKFKTELKKKGWKKDEERNMYFSEKLNNSTMRIESYSGSFIGESASLNLVLHKDKFVMGVQINLSYDKKELALEKMHSIMNTVKEKYNYKISSELDPSGNTSYEFEITNDYNFLIGKIDLSILQYDDNDMNNCTLSISYYDMPHLYFKKLESEKDI